MKQSITKTDFRAILKEVILYVVTGAVIVAVFTLVLTPTIVSGSCMEGTIADGAVLISTIYDRNDVNRYDIMVFISPDDPESYYIKRVIGLPGETILVYDGEVYADGVKLDSSFVPEKMGRSGDGEYVVPDGCYFMLGDNRNVSLDSRFWDKKFVPAENMFAKAKLTIFPFTGFGSLAYGVD